MLSLSLLLAGVVPAVHAFCGTYVGDATAPVYNAKSEVAIARVGTTTTLTLGNDYSGQLSDFALVIPVPDVLGPEDVRTVLPELLEEAARYSEPRVVAYTCEDFYVAPSGPSLGCAEYSVYMSDQAGGYADTAGANVEAEFTAGEYQLVVLSAEESAGLLSWLTNNGYTVSYDAEQMLQEYIDAGSYFLAAKVSFENLPDGQDFLSPLQITYSSEVFSLPVRLGTVNSPGEQDLIVYVLSDYAQGRVGVSNYPEADPPTDCMMREDATADFGTYYNTAFNAAIAGNTRASWVAEYGWAPYHCDPCVDGEALSDWAVMNLGFPDGSQSAYFTRIHMRYTPAQVDQDLSFYFTGSTDTIQQRYVQWNESLIDRFEVCGEGWLTDPIEEDEAGLCAAEFRELRREDRQARRGCAAAVDLPEGSFLAGATALALALAAARRRGR